MLILNNLLFKPILKLIDKRKERIVNAAKKLAEIEKIEAEQQKLAEEAAAKKAYEEELAKKNAELQAQMNKVNDAISMGKTKLSMGEVAEALKYFEDERYIEKQLYDAKIITQR